MKQWCELYVLLVFLGLRMQAHLVFVSVIIPHDSDRRWSDSDATCGVVMRYWSRPAGLCNLGCYISVSSLLGQQNLNNYVCITTASTKFGWNMWIIYEDQQSLNRTVGPQAINSHQSDQTMGHVLLNHWSFHRVNINSIWPSDGNRSKSHIAWVGIGSPNGLLLRHKGISWINADLS